MGHKVHSFSHPMLIEHLPGPGPVLWHKDGTANPNSWPFPLGAPHTVCGRALLMRCSSLCFLGPGRALVGDQPPTPMEVPSLALEGGSLGVAHVFQGGGGGSFLHGVSYIHTGQLQYF